MKGLAAKLEAAGLRVLIVEDRLLVSPFGGRILGLLPDGETNLYWINPQIFQPESLVAWRAHQCWSNLGGERAWISPEIDTNLPDPKRFEASYSVPPQIDPGNYTWTEEGGTIVLSQSISLRWLRTGLPIELALQRTIQPIDAPPFAVPAGLACAGYSVVSRLAAQAPLGLARPAVWSLIQVPGGGTAIANVRRGVKPVSFINAASWTAAGATIRTEARTTSSFKWSLRASDSVGRLMYHSVLDDHRASLVVRDFPVTADSDYADCPSHTPSDTGHVCQVYVDDGRQGGFAELESHAPSLRVGVREVDESRCSTWGFIGRAAEIAALQSQLSS